VPVDTRPDVVHDNDGTEGGDDDEENPSPVLPEALSGGAVWTVVDVDGGGQALVGRRGCYAHHPDVCTEVGRPS